ncbi:hypothetical protein LCGC14_2758340, partial [marine sediment metagenome]
EAAAQEFEHDSGGGIPGVQAGVSADLRFHRAVCDASDNDYYLGLFNYLGASLQETMLAGRLQAVKRGSDSHDAVQEHHGIAAAIASRDPDRARAEMRTHLRLSSSRLLGQLRVGKC